MKKDLPERIQTAPPFEKLPAWLWVAVLLAGLLLARSARAAGHWSLRTSSKNR